MSSPSEFTSTGGVRVTRTPPPGGAGEAKAARTPILISFTDLDGFEVAFDPTLVVGVRSAVNSKYRFSIVTVQAQPGATTTVYQVLEGSPVVINRINLHRRGLGEKIEEMVAQMKLEQQAAPVEAGTAD